MLTACIEMCKDLEYSNGEVSGGLGGEPEPEVGVRTCEVLQGLLQLLEPVDEEVAVLQHQPVTSLCSCLQELQCHLRSVCTQYVTQ